ncbi:MAG: antibiotic biosynthesis monooxygenase [Dehalococcoidales bacterium]|nr:antibiotic biosynthesis monooxygenase [Dehalococcoidales bacterium]
MIKVIVGYKLKEGADFDPILRKLRSQAMQLPGFIGAENMLSEQDRHIIALVSTWEKLEDWREWDKSKIRQDILKKAEPLLAESPKVTIYKLMPTIKWFG